MLFMHRFIVILKICIVITSKHHRSVSRMVVSWTLSGGRALKLIKGSKLNINMYMFFLSGKQIIRNKLSYL